MTATIPWGIGLRPQHLDELLALDQLPALEVLVEQFAFQSSGSDWAALHALKQRTSLVLHGLHLNIGGYDPLNMGYLDEIKRLCSILKPTVYSDHLAFSQSEGRQSFDLLPVPRTPTQQQHIIDRVRQVQDTLGRQLALENISAYLAYETDSIPELEFLQGIADQSGCGILLDLNNLFVNAHNFGFDPHSALLSLDAASILQYHASGHRKSGRLLHDTHDQFVTSDVWALYHEAIARFGTKTLILERDDDDVTLEDIFDDLARGNAYEH